MAAGASSSSLPESGYNGWPDAECFALSGQLYDRADRDFNGTVDGDETRAAIAQLEAAMGFQDSAPAAPLPPGPEAWQGALMLLCSQVGPEKFKEAARKALSQPPSGPPRLDVGPVVGKVTDTSARILVECSHEADVCCVLRAEVSGQEAARQVLRLPRGRPKAFVFRDLAPETRYLATFEGAEVLVDRCSFKTLPEEGFSLAEGQQPVFAVASCNNVYVTRQLPPKCPGDLWFDLEQRLRQGQQVDYMLHLGDNVYNDSDWHLIEKGKRPLEGRTCKWGVAHGWLSSLKEEEQWQPYREDIAELFRTAYRETWGHPATRWVLANVPNLMILDDHDLRDDWGDRRVDLKEESLDWFMARVAYDVVCEYQRQLREDWEGEPKEDFHFHRFGDVGLVFLDVRICKTFHRVREERAEEVLEETAKLPMLGKTQWAALKRALGEGGELDACSAVMVLVPEPVAYVSHTATMAAGNTVCDDLLGQWSATEHLAEVPMLLETLTDWRARRPGRDLLLIGGDVHEGGWSDLVWGPKDGKPELRIRQLTTSAICNSMTKVHEALAVLMTRNAAAVVDNFELAGGWKVRHYDWSNWRNYALIDAHVAPRGTLTVRLKRARGLLNADASKIGSAFGWNKDDKSDPYVKVKIGDQEQRTEVVENNLDPEWHAELRFQLDGSQHFIMCTVMDRDPGKDDFLGKAKVGFNIIRYNEAVPWTGPLTDEGGQPDPKRGVLELELFFEPTCNPSASTFTSCPDIILGGQLVTSNGSEVLLRKRRTSKDPTFTAGKRVLGMAKELKKHIFG